jgi:hypothetical protein
MTTLPDGVRELENCTIYLTDKGTIVVLSDPHDLGYPEGDGHPHSCDGMGCGQEHVLARGPVTGDAWSDSSVQTLLGLLDELLCRIGTEYQSPYGPWPDDGEERGSWEHEATALVQSVLCQTADWAHVEARLAELRGKSELST